tara:strand:+ start:338 stop:481 length:144 start_codon:yes stop_codon:yes gene_type:complete
MGMIILLVIIGVICGLGKYAIDQGMQIEKDKECCGDGCCDHENKENK